MRKSSLSSLLLSVTGPWRKPCPFVQEGQIILLMPGSGGSLEFAKIFRQKKVKKEIPLAESVTLLTGSG